jgi:putative toxin-antitoxin system antitoxin component (TIGR02293 family)
MGAASIAALAPEIWRHALDTFTTEERVLQWMNIPLAELHNRTPEQVLLDEPNSPEVEAILTRIDYGVFG